MMELKAVYLIDAVESLDDVAKQTRYLVATEQRPIVFDPELQCVRIADRIIPITNVREMRGASLFGFGPTSVPMETRIAIDHSEERVVEMAAQLASLGAEPRDIVTKAEPKKAKPVTTPKR